MTILNPLLAAVIGLLEPQDMAGTVCSWGVNVRLTSVTGKKMI